MVEFDELDKELVEFAAAAMHRDVIVLDEGCRELAAAMRFRGFRIILPALRLSDDQIKHDVLAGRTLITKNGKDFKDDASSFGYSVIALDHLRFVDPEEKDVAINKTAKVISDAFQKFKLKSLKSQCFVLWLYDDGKHRFEMMD